MVCAISIVPKPITSVSSRAFITATKRSIMETPVTISGFIMGMFVTLVTVPLRNLLLMCRSPRAANVPITVAIREESTAKIKEFLSAVIASLICAAFFPVSDEEEV